jgi:hypothetical protein
VSRYNWGIQHIGHRDFDEVFASPDAECIDGERVRSDSETLAASVKPIKRYVDKHIAHYDRSRKPSDVPSFDDLDQAINALGEIFKHYLILLTGADRDPIEPIPQYDWVAPFRMPWIPTDPGEP